MQRAYNFEFICLDQNVRIIATVDLLPCLLEFRGGSEPFFKDLFPADVFEPLLVFSGYEDSDLRSVNPVDLSRPVAALKPSGLSLPAFQDKGKKAALKADHMHL